MTRPDPSAPTARTVRRVGLVLGVVAALALQLFPHPEALGRDGWIVASLGLVMAIWWATEAIPIPATSLLPLVVLPLTGVLSTKEAGAPYASQIVLLLMGGFIIAVALERWNLHERIALNIVVRAGGRPRMLILGFMIAAALLSMWISNTATTLMMIPIALSVAHAEAGDDGMRGPFTLALLLGVAYAASIGGVATPVGTPTNLIAMQFLADAGRDISFVHWMALGLPVAAVMIPASWYALTRWAFPVDAARPAAAGAEQVRTALAALGRITTPEIRTALVFGAVAVFWISNSFVIGVLEIPHLQAIVGSQLDATIAVAGAVAMFLVPAGGESGKGRALLDWETAVRIPWGVLLLFGGGLSLAAAINKTGLAEWIGGLMGGLTALPVVFIVLALVLVIIFLTELTSNVATVTAFMPVILALAGAGDINPVMLAAPAALAGSFAFMLPVATAPNAIVYGSGHVAIGDMVQAGFRLNLIGIVLITAAAAILTPLLFA